MPHRSQEVCESGPPNPGMGTTDATRKHQMTRTAQTSPQMMNLADQMLRGVDQAQQRFGPLSFTFAVVKKLSDDQEVFSAVALERKRRLQRMHRALPTAADRGFPAFPVGI